MFTNEAEHQAEHVILKAAAEEAENERYQIERRAREDAEQAKRVEREISHVQAIACEVRRLAYNNSDDSASFFTAEVDEKTAALTICGKARVESSSGQETRMMSTPASSARRIWSMVAAASAVSVLVMVCTLIGASPPTGTLPTMICRDLRRWMSR